jgi:pimeloyl-ACP methyl ester carboxylesterase
MSEDKDPPGQNPTAKPGPATIRQEFATSSSEISTANMGTHARPPSPCPRKKIWHYFYEFLMLFLAVFCGFLTENFREHYVERERAEQYILSFYQDLRADTVKIADLIHFDQDKVQTLNNMFTCYDTVIKNWKDTYCMWALYRKSQANRKFIVTDRTVSYLYPDAGGDEFHVTGNFKDWEFWDSLPGIKVAVLVIGGMQDEMNPEDIKKEGQLIPNSRTYLCPNGSHMRCMTTG